MQQLIGEEVQLVNLRIPALISYVSVKRSSSHLICLYFPYFVFFFLVNAYHLPVKMLKWTELLLKYV